MSTLRLLQVLLLSISMLLGSCSVESSKSRFLLAEKLWDEGNHEAAVREFEKVIQKEGDSDLGKRALYRAAMTQALYLNQYGEAIDKLRRFIEKSDDAKAVWEARKWVGEILYSKIEDYGSAALFYRNLVELRPRDVSAPEFLFREGKSLYYMQNFTEALRVFKELIKRFPSLSLSEKARIEVAHCLFSDAGKKSAGSKESFEKYQDAMDAYNDVIKRNAKSELVVEARFGVANCLESMDQLDRALQAYENLRSEYPSPKLVQLKVMRIQERRAQKNR